MIGTDEMSSSGMDISESFRAEDLAKTDFFDFVTAPDMGIGIGVGVGVGVEVGVGVSLHHPHHERTSAHLTNDGGGGGGGGGGSDGGDAASNGHIRDPTLHAYDQFWNSDKDQSRLDSTIFEDLDRYCWQQHHQQQQQQQEQQHQQHQQQQQQQQASSQAHAPAQMSPTSPTHHLGPASAVSSSGASVNNSSVTSSASSGSLSQPGSAGTASSLDNNNTDGQIYTITVLNGNEPWLKREPEAHLGSSLDLDSLLGNFPGYIKSEYPYDDSGFGTDGAKDNGEGLSSMSQVPSLQGMSGGTGGGGSGGGLGQSLPSLMTAISVAAGGNGMASDSAASVGQQFATFQNNNNDWHMADNNADQNSAESLLRSALQGKGYSKGLQLQNGLALLPTSPSVKEDEMRRMLFPTDADTLAFADSTLSAAQMFDDPQNSPHNQHPAIHQHAASRNGAVGPGPGSGSGSSLGASAGATPNAAIIVEDMFLSLESAFSDDFEKIKRIANEVQQFCTSTPNVPDYPGSEVLMQISPPASQGLQQLHSPATTPTGGPPQPPGGPQLVVHPPQPPPQPLKPEVSTSTASSSRVPVSPSASKITKKYKRSSSSSASSSSQVGASHNNNNNNNNPSVMNHNSSSNGHGNTGSRSSAGGAGGGGGGASNGSSSGSSSSSGANSSSPTHCNGQRKERSLHYCSICSKGFKDKYSVNVHIRTHTGEKPFACSLCGKSFRQKAHLAKHYQTHMAQKSNGSLMKSAGSAKHHRSAAAAAAMGGGGSSVPISGQHRALGGVGVGTVSGVVGNGPSTVLPPATGLLANR